MKNYLKRFNFLFQSHYRKSLITVLLLSSLPGIVMGFIIFLAVKGQVENELKTIHQSQLHQTAMTIDDHFSNAELLLAHWAFDPEFTDDLKHLDFSYQYKEVHQIYRTLLLMEGSNPLFSRAELWVNTPVPRVISKDGYRDLLESEISAFRQLLERKQALFWDFAGGEIRLVHRVPGVTPGNRPPSGAFVVTLDRQSVLNLLATLTPYQGGAAVLFDEDGRQLIHTGYGAGSEDFGKTLLQEILKHRERTGHEQTGTFLMNRGGQTLSVTYGSFNRLGTAWTFISAAPLTSITKPVTFISQLIIGLNLLVLLLAGTLSWFASRRLYSPIEKLIHKLNIHRSASAVRNRNEFELIEAQWNNLSRESQILQTRLDQQLPFLREGFLLQLLQGYMVPFNEKELRDRMQHYGWDPANRQFVILLVQLFGFSKLEGRFSEGDEGLVTFAAANIVEELVRRSVIDADVINFHDLSVGVLVFLPASGDVGRRKEQLTAFSEEIIKAIEDIIKLHVTVTISRSTDSVRLVPVIYEEARMAFRFRYLQESSQIIDLEKLDEDGRLHDFDYPFDLEKEILYSLRMGDEEEACARIEAFIRHLTGTYANEGMLKQGVLQLLGSMLHIVLQSGINTHRLYEGDNLFEKLGQIREPEEMAGWFARRVVRPFMAEWSQKKDQQLRRMVEKTIDLLNEQYCTDISLESCADALKISPFVLSKAFKQVTGVNFIDYLTGIRLERAKRLLRETDMKISEVANRVGYQHSYFNRLFKSREGMTPGQYREAVKSG